MVQLLEKETSVSPEPRGQLPTSQRAGTTRDGETGSGLVRVLVASNRDEVAALIAKLRPHELRWLAEDVMNAAIQACNEDRARELRDLIVSWLETAEVMISTRRRLRHILRARQEMRDHFGSPGVYGRTA